MGNRLEKLRGHVTPLADELRERGIGIEKSLHISSEDAYQRAFRIAENMGLVRPNCEIMTLAIIETWPIGVQALYDRDHGADYPNREEITKSVTDRLEEMIQRSRINPQFRLSRFQDLLDAVPIASFHAMKDNFPAIYPDNIFAGLMEQSSLSVGIVAAGGVEHTVIRQAYSLPDSEISQNFA